MTRTSKKESTDWTGGFAWTARAATTLSKNIFSGTSEVGNLLEDELYIHFL
jgi:hypothetical protein